MSAEMSTLFSSTQLGFGVPGGIEAAVHNGRKVLQNLPLDEALASLARSTHSAVTTC